MSRTNIKEKAKVPKIRDFAHASPSFEQIYSQPLSKFSTHQSDHRTTNHLPVINSDTDRFLPQTNNSYWLPQSAKSGFESGILNKFSSTFQDASQTINQYLGSFKGSGYTNLNYEDLSAFAFDPKAIGFFNTFSDTERFKKLADLSSDSVMSKTTNQLFKMANKNTGSLTTRALSNATENTSTFTAQVNKVFDSDKKPQTQKPGFFRGDSLTDRNRTKSDFRSSNITEATPRKQSNFGKPGRILLTEESQLSENKSTRSKRPVLKLMKPKEPIIQKATLGLELPPLDQMVSPPKTNWTSSDPNTQQERISIVPVRIETEQERASLIIKDLENDFQQDDDGIQLERNVSSTKTNNGGKTTKAKSTEHASPGLKNKVHINLKDVKKSPTGPTKLAGSTPRRGGSVQIGKTPRMSKFNVLSLNLHEGGEATSRNTITKPKSTRSIEWSSVVVDLEREKSSDPERQGEKGSLQILLNSEKSLNSKTNLKKEAIPKGTLAEKFRKKVLAVKLGSRFISSISHPENQATPKMAPKQSLSPDSSPLRRGNTGLPSFSLPQKGKSASPQPSKTPQKAKEEPTHTSSSTKKHKKSSPRKGSSSEKDIAVPKEKKREKEKESSKTQTQEIKSDNGGPVIKVSSPEAVTTASSKPALEHKSTIKSVKRSSRRESVKNSHPHHHHSSNGSSPDLKSSHKPDPRNPKSFFDFQTRKMPHHKPKKIRNLRNVTDPVPAKNIFEESEMEFISAFDLTLKNAIKHSSAATPIVRQQTEESDNISRNYLREQSKISAPLEELLRQTSEDEETTKPSYNGEGRKTLNNEADSSQISKPQLSQPPQSGQQLFGGAIVIEDMNQHLLPKTYSHRNGIFTILINPPIEEAATVLEEASSPSSGNTQKILENTETTTDPPTATEPPSKILHFKFDVNNRKILEEESSFFSEDPSRYEMAALEQAYRKKAEEFFQVEDIYQSKMENLNIKSQKLRIRSNFLTFVEKVVVKPTEKWALCELITSYVPQFGRGRTVTATEYSDSTVSIKTKNLYDYKYKPKSFYITLDPFKLAFVFLLTVDALTLKTIILSQNDIEDDVTFDEDENTHAKRLESQTLIFSTGEEYSTKSRLNDPTEAKRILKFNSIMVRINAQTILGMKKAFHFSVEDAFRSKPGAKRMTTKNYYNLLGRISMILENSSDGNWDYIKKSILSIYEYLIYGNFELKKTMGAELVVKEVKEPEKIDPLEKILEENAKQSKKRETYIGAGKKMLRTVSNLKQVLAQNQTQVQQQQSPRNPLTSADTLPLDPQKVSIIQEDKGEYDSDRKIMTNDSLRAAFSLPKQATTKPALKQKDGQESVFRKNLTNIEKSKTIIGFDTPKIRKDQHIMANIVQKAQEMKTSKTPAESPTKDRQGKLLIPDSLGKLSRHGTSGSPSNGPRVLESRLNTVEEKGLKKLGTNISFTPSSDQDTPAKEDNGLFFQNQSTIHSQLTRERTKILDKSAKSKRELSHSKSPNREKDDPAGQILQALQLKPKSEVNQARKSIVLSVQPRKFDGNKNTHPISGNQSPVMKHRPAPRKVDDEKGLENYLFNAVYCNQFFELREIMVLYPKNILGVQDEEMNTLLIAAAQSGHKDIVQLFLNLGCDVNAQNKQGNTALHVSLAYHHYDIADLLVKHGAKQSLTNARGKTAWEQ